MIQHRYDIIIIGAGPAGLIAAIESYGPSRKICILEKMPTPAMKLKISGKGRCNITNSANRKEFMAHFGKNGRFLKYAFAKFFNTDLLRYFETLGIQFKLERGGRYFPQHDNAMEIVTALLSKVKERNIPLSTHSEVTGITKLSDGEFHITIQNTTTGANKRNHRRTLKAGKVLLATGGKSYPNTGSSGTGFTLASQLGHTVTHLSPSLVPLVTKGDTAKKLQGLSLRNVTVSVWCNGKKVAEKFGEMIFTDVGVSGPIILSLSRTIVKCLDETQNVYISIDLKPALDHKKVEQRLIKEIREHSKHQIRTLLKTLLPRKMIAIFLERLNIPGEKQLNQITAEERRNLRMLLKEFRCDVSGYRSFDSAIVTSGGICLQEIHPRTLESKLVKGLYFAGEIIDIDADTGGFNLQAAFSTGWLAGRSL